MAEPPRRSDWDADAPGSPGFPEASSESDPGTSERLASDPITFAYRSAYQIVQNATAENERRSQHALEAAERIRAAAEQAASSTLKRAEEENAQRLAETRQRAESLVQRAESLVVFARRQLHALEADSLESGAFEAPPAWESPAARPSRPATPAEPAAEPSPAADASEAGIAAATSGIAGPGADTSPLQPPQAETAEFDEPAAAAEDIGEPIAQEDEEWRPSAALADAEGAETATWSSAETTAEGETETPTAVAEVDTQEPEAASPGGPLYSQIDEVGEHAAEESEAVAEEMTAAEEPAQEPEAALQAALQAEPEAESQPDMESQPEAEAGEAEAPAEEAVAEVAEPEAEAGAAETADAEAGEGEAAAEAAEPETAEYADEPPPRPAAMPFRSADALGVEDLPDDSTAEADQEAGAESGDEGAYAAYEGGPREYAEPPVELPQDLFDAAGSLEPLAPPEGEQAAAAASEPASQEPPIAQEVVPVSLELVAGPFSRFSQLASFTQALGELQGVSSTTTRQFFQGWVHLRVRYESNVPLATRVVELRQFKPEVISAGPEKVEVRISTE